MFKNTLLVIKSNRVFFIFKLIFNLADLELSPPFASAISTFPNFLFSLVIVYFVSENFPSFFTSK